MEGVLVMNIVTNQPLSEFGQAAVALDGEMRNFECLARELETLTIESDKGMDRGSELLTEIVDCRERLEVRMREMARALEQGRQRNEKAEQIIALRTQVWQQRRTEVEVLLERYKKLGDSVRVLNATVAQLRGPIVNVFTPEERENLQLHLNQATEPLAVLVEEAKNLLKEARSANMRSLERNAGSLCQTLQAARNRLNLISERRIHLVN